MIVDYERVETNKVAIVCCDVEVRKRVFELMNKEQISREVVDDWVKSGVTKLEVRKSGAMQHCLPNRDVPVKVLGATLVWGTGQVQQVMRIRVVGIVASWRWHRSEFVYHW